MVGELLALPVELLTPLFKHLEKDDEKSLTLTNKRFFAIFNRKYSYLQWTFENEVKNIHSR